MAGFSVLVIFHKFLVVMLSVPSLVTVRPEGAGEGMEGGRRGMWRIAVTHPWG